MFLILFCVVSVLIPSAVNELPKYRTECNTVHGFTTTATTATTTTTTATATATAAATTTATTATAATTATTAASSDQWPSKIFISFVLKPNSCLN